MKSKTPHLHHFNRFRAFYTEIFMVLCVAVISYFMAGAYMKAFPAVPDFSQNGFGPVVMKVCEKGFVGTNEIVDLPTLHHFLDTYPDNLNATFDCSSLPSNIKPSPLNELATHAIYLMNTVGFFWKHYGISYNALLPLFCLTFAITMSLAYGVFRLGMNRFFALAGVLTLITLGSYLEYLRHFRDFSVAPFVLAILICTGILIKKAIPHRVLLIISTLGGLILGLGLGFRNDSLLYVFLFPLAFLLFAKLTDQSPWKWKGIALIVYLAGFLTTGFPVLKAYSDKGGNILFHVTLMGFSNFQNHWLGVKRSPVYSNIEDYSDGSIYGPIESYEERAHHISHIITYSSKEYSHISRQYLFLLIKNFPADFVIRTYAAMLQTLHLPYESYLHWFTLTIKYFKTDFIIQYFSIFVAIAALGILTFYSVRIALFTGGLLLFLIAYPVVQYSPRHYFYLSIVSLWLLLFLFQTCYTAANNLHENPRYLSTIYWNQFLPKLFKYLISIFLLFLMLIALLFFSREYQQKHLTDLFSQYEKAKLKPLTFNTRVSPENSSVTLTLDPWLYRNPAFLLTAPDYNYELLTGYLKFPMKYGLMMLDFDTTHCGNHHLVLNLEKLNPIGLEVKKSLKLFYPVVHEWDLPMEDVEMTQDTFRCLKGIYQVEPDSVPPLWLTVKLTDDWRAKTLYQTLENDTFPDRIQTLFVYPSDLSPQKAWETLPLKTPPIEWVDNLSHIVSQQQNKITISGKPPYPYNYLVEFGTQHISISDFAHHAYYFLVEGEIQSGGLSVGLIKDQAWSPIINIPGKGKFKVIIKLDAPGQYQPILANYLLPGMNNETSITKAGWITQEIN